MDLKSLINHAGPRLTQRDKSTFDEGPTAPEKGQGFEAQLQLMVAQEPPAAMASQVQTQAHDTQGSDGDADGADGDADDTLPAGSDEGDDTVEAGDDGVDEPSSGRLRRERNGHVGARWGKLGKDEGGDGEDGGPEPSSPQALDASGALALRLAVATPVAKPIATADGADPQSESAAKASPKAGSLWSKAGGHKLPAAATSETASATAPGMAGDKTASLAPEAAAQIAQPDALPTVHALPPGTPSSSLLYPQTTPFQPQPVAAPSWMTATTPAFVALTPSHMATQVSETALHLRLNAHAGTAEVAWDLGGNARMQVRLRVEKNGVDLVVRTDGTTPADTMIVERTVRDLVRALAQAGLETRSLRVMDPGESGEVGSDLSGVARGRNPSDGTHASEDAARAPAPAGLTSTRPQRVLGLINVVV